MTGERELPEGERPVTRGEEEDGSGGGAGVKNPTWRTLGSISLEERRESMGKEAGSEDR